MHPKTEIDLDLDGITHINVSYLAKTRLGKLLNDSSDLTYKHVDEEGKVHEYTAYGYLATLLTGCKDHRLAGADADTIRQHMTNHPIRWTRAATIFYREALKQRVSYENSPLVWKLLRANTLPIVSYTVRGGKIVMRKNDRILVNFYNNYKPPLPKGIVGSETG